MKKPRRKLQLASVTMLVACAGCAVDPVTPAEQAATACARYQVTPGNDATASFEAAMTAAAADSNKDLLGPSGAGQVRVYLPAGVYRLRQIHVASNVRFEIEPGAVIRPVAGLDGPGPSDWGLFELGTLDKPVVNTTFTAGDGCGGPGTPVFPTRFKPASTDFRGNDPKQTPFGTRGMANAAIPFDDHWPVATMWTLDLDPRATGAEWQITGFYIRNASFVTISRLFTIENAEQRAGADGGELDGVTSKTTAMMIKPPDGATFHSNVEQLAIARHLLVEWHYNILAPSGQGPNQVRGCIDCTFRHIFSHGGVALRGESDGIRTTCANNGCDCVGTHGEGLETYSTVDQLHGDDIAAAFGNVVMTLTPHCLPNGTASGRNLSGTAMSTLVSISGGEADASAAAGYRNVTITSATGCGTAKALAEHADPQHNAYQLGPSIDAVHVGPRAPAITWTGTFSWPTPPAPGGLPRGDLPQNIAITPRTCP